jgi:hypothetical protein
MEDPTLYEDEVPPDEDQEARYNWDEEFQRHIIALLLCDSQFLLQSLDLVKPSYFTNKAHSKAASILFRHFEKYKVMPDKTFLMQEIKTELKDNKSLAYYLGEVQVLYEYFKPGLDSREYLTDKISYFAKIQAVRTAFNKSLKKIEENPESEETWDGVYDILRDAMTVDRNFDIGVDYFKNLRDRYEQMEDDDTVKDVFPTGFASIDEKLKYGGYRRGELFAVCADSGVGKSIYLACMSRRFLLRGHKGVYISCEVDEGEINERMDAIMTGYPVQNLIDHKEDIFDKLEGRKAIDFTDEGSPIFFHPENTVGSMLTKQFPAGQLTINMIQAYLNQIKFHGYQPDFAIVDYLGEMKMMPGMKTYESMERLARDLRGLASMENMFFATALQPNRAAKEAQKEWGHIGQQHLADAYGVMRPLDGCLMLNQNDLESSLHIGRGWVEKNRKAQKHYQFHIEFDPENLRISEIAHETYQSLRNKHENDVKKDIEEDKDTIPDKSHVVAPKKYNPSKGETDGPDDE